MAAILSHLSVAPGLGNQVEYRRFIWDIAAGDAGAAAAYDIMTADGALIIVHAHAKVLASVSTGSSPTIKWGITGDDDRFMNTTQGAAANLTTGAVVVPPALEGTPNVIATPVYLASAAKVLMTIGTATITAGKIEFVLGLLKP